LIRGEIPGAKCSARNRWPRRSELRMLHVWNLWSAEKSHGTEILVDFFHRRTLLGWLLPVQNRSGILTNSI